MTTTPAHDTLTAVLTNTSSDYLDNRFGMSASVEEIADGILRAHAAEVRAAALDEAADKLAALDPAKAALAGQHAWNDAAGIVRHMAAQERRLLADETPAAAARPDTPEAHQPHVCYVLERAISDGWVEERVVDEPAAAAQAVEDYDAWWLLPATLRVVRRTSLSAVVSVHEVAKPGPCTCGHTHEQHLPICGRSRQCRSLCNCDAYRPDNTTGA